MNSTIASNIIADARINAHVGRMSSSAKLALSDALACFASCNYASAARRATDSLEYSVGIFHPACHAARVATGKERA